MARFHQIAAWPLSSLGVVLLICGAVFAQPSAALAQQTQSYNCNTGNPQCGTSDNKFDCESQKMCAGVPQCKCYYIANHWSCG
jgi:hypothetical protein